MRIETAQQVIDIADGEPRTQVGECTYVYLHTHILSYTYGIRWIIYRQANFLSVDRNSGNGEIDYTLQKTDLWGREFSGEAVVDMSLLNWLFVYFSSKYE